MTIDLEPRAPYVIHVTYDGKDQVGTVTYARMRYNFTVNKEVPIIIQVSDGSTQVKRVVVLKTVELSSLQDGRPQNIPLASDDDQDLKHNPIMLMVQLTSPILIY